MDDIENDNENHHDNIEQQSYEHLSRPLSEMDLHSLEILDIDSSSQEENSSDRLEAAVSLSNLSVGLQHAQITLNTQNTSRVQLSSTSNRGVESGMLVIMSTQGLHDHTTEQQEDESEEQSLPPLLSQPSLEQESTRSIDLDSSMESEESSRQLESFQSILSENDPVPSSDQNVTVITSLTRTQQQQQQQQTQDVTISDTTSNPSSPDINSAARSRSRLRERDGQSIATGMIG